MKTMNYNLTEVNGAITILGNNFRGEGRELTEKEVNTELRRLLGLDMFPEEEKFTVCEILNDKRELEKFRKRAVCLEEEGELDTYLENIGLYDGEVFKRLLKCHDISWDCFYKELGFILDEKDSELDRLSQATLGEKIEVVKPIRDRKIFTKKTVEIEDKFNENKVWVITRYETGHYYLVQKVYGKKFGKGLKCSKKWIEEVVNYDVDILMAWL